MSNKVLFAVTVIVLASLSCGSDATRAPATVKPPTPTTIADPFQRMVVDVTAALGDLNREGVPHVGSITQDANGDIVVVWALNDNFNVDMIKGSAQKDTIDILRVIAASGLTYTGVRCQGTFGMVDKFGNTSEDVVIDVYYSADTIAKINFDNMLRDNIWIIADRADIHPQFR